jgi:hypothetical protein
MYSHFMPLSPKALDFGVRAAEKAFGLNHPGLGFLAPEALLKAARAGQAANFLCFLYKRSF